jgi:acyl-CoA thioester hydrolase
VGSVTEPAQRQPTWSAPVRYAEADQQGVVFNSHYLLYCDEASSAFCRQREILEFGEMLRVKKSTLTWTAPAVWGEVVDVYVTCPRVGRTSFTMCFDVKVGDRECCTVETVYVHADVAGVPQPIPDDVARLLAAQTSA